MFTTLPTTRSTTRAATARPRVGLVAGWGRFPLVLAQSLTAAGYDVYGLGIRDHCDPAIIAHCREFAWIGLAKIGFCLKFFRRHGITRATMAGKVHKVRLFQPHILWNHFPDWTGFKTFYPHFVSGKKDKKDDTLLTAIVEAFARGGVEMNPATDYAPQLLVPAGPLTQTQPTAAQWRDIEFGWKLAREMGRLDIGQSVAVKGRAVLAVEAIEGTDLCIRRAGDLCESGGFTIVKVAKPQQDMRFDVPTVGLGTLESMVAAGAACLAIEAGKTILVDAEQFLATANHHRLTVIAIAPHSRPGLE